MGGGNNWNLLWSKPDSRVGTNQNSGFKVALSWNKELWFAPTLDSGLCPAPLPPPLIWDHPPPHKSERFGPDFIHTGFMPCITNRVEINSALVKSLF